MTAANVYQLASIAIATPATPNRSINVVSGGNMVDNIAIKKRIIFGFMKANRNPSTAPRRVAKPRGSSTCSGCGQSATAPNQSRNSAPANSIDETNTGVVLKMAEKPKTANNA
jgi:hypothetical protein